jgi:hypothetical protein
VQEWASAKAIGCVASSLGFAVKAVMAGLFVNVVGVVEIGSEQGHLAVVTKNGIGLLELAVDTDALVEDEAFTRKMFTAHLFEVFEDTAVQLENLLEALLLHERAGFLAADASGAKHHHGLGFKHGIQFSNRGWKVAEVIDLGIQGLLKRAEADLVVVADIEEGDRAVFIQPGFEFPCGDLGGRAVGGIHPIDTEGDDFPFDFHQHALERLGGACAFLGGEILQSRNGADDGKDGIQLRASSGQEEVDAFGGEENGAFETELAAASKELGFPFFQLIHGGEAIASEVDDRVHRRDHFSPKRRVVRRGNLRREMRMKMSCCRVIDPALPAKDLSEFAQGFADEIAGRKRGVEPGEGFLRFG